VGEFSRSRERVPDRGRVLQIEGEGGLLATPDRGRGRPARLIEGVDGVPAGPDHGQGRPDAPDRGRQL
jgi:hypothetical protein